MIDLSTYKGKKVGVLGLGKSGISAAHALLKSGVFVTAWDDLPDQRAKAFEEGIPVRDLRAIDWSEMDFLLMSPGIPHTFPEPHPVAALAKSYDVPLVCDVELLLATQSRATFVGITGTNGKSTTTALMTHVLNFLQYPAQEGGNIGIPALDLRPSADTYVLELSSYQIELIYSKVLRSAVLLNISADHLDRHGGMDGYVRAKAKIFSHLQKGGTAVISIDDEYCAQIYKDLQALNLRIIPVSAQKEVPYGVYVKGGYLIDHRDGIPQRIADLRNFPTLRGIHNHQNIASVYAALVNQYALGDFQRALETYPGLPHRQEIVVRHKHILAINDSKATNLEAAAKSLASFDHIYWIVGGRMKEGGEDLISVLPYFAKVRKVYTIGESATIYANLLKAHLPVEELSTLEQAVPYAMADALQSGHKATVLLAPACASWDQFKNFEHRGQVFKSLVLDWVKNDGV